MTCCFSLHRMFILRISEGVLELHRFCSLNAVVFRTGLFSNVLALYRKYTVAGTWRMCVYRTSHSNGLWFWRLTKLSVTLLHASALWWKEPRCTHRPDFHVVKGCPWPNPIVKGPHWLTLVRCSAFIGQLVWRLWNFNCNTEGQLNHTS